MYKIVKNMAPMKTVQVNKKEVQIPEDWNYCAIGDVFKTSTGNTPSKTNDTYWSNDKNDFPWLTTPNFKKANSASGYLTPLGKSKSRIAPEDTLLVSCIATVGETFYTKNSVAYNQQINSVFPSNLMSNLYLKYYIDCHKNIFIKHADVSIVRIMNKSKFNQFEFTFPVNKHEQIRIASYLSFIEASISKAEQLIDFMGTEFRYYQSELLSGRMIVKNNEVVKNMAPMKTVQVNKKEVQIPEDWKVEKIGDIVVKKDKSYFMAKDFDGGEYPAYTCSEKVKQCHKYNADGHNILLSTGGMPIVNWYDGKCAFSSDVFNIHSIDENRFFSRFISFYLKNKTETDLKKMFYGTGLKHLNKKELMAHDAITPPIDEQIRISEFLSKYEDDIRKMKDLLAEQKQIFQWSSKVLLSGEYILLDD